MDKKRRLAITDQSGGRNAYDPPWAINANQCADAVNVDFYRTPFANKRGGMLALSTAFSSGGPFAGALSFLGRHMPSTLQSAAELWGVDEGLIFGRLAGAVTWVEPTKKDSPTGNGWDTTATSINGKYCLAYKTAVNRNHFWDGSTVRRGGLATPGVPTAANQGAGAYPATGRDYRVRWTRQSGGITIGRSEPGTLLQFTPSGANGAVRVTQPTPPGEGETHWEIETSTDLVTFYRLTTIVIGTPFYDDTALVATYVNNPLSEYTGKYTLQKAYRFVAADQNRLLGLSSFTSTDKQNRLEMSAVIGSADIADEERVDTTTNYYLDFEELDSGQSTGLAGPIFGTFFVFKEYQVFQLTPTGSTDQPYRVDAISKTIGALRHYAITIAEDADGNPALYWMSHRGPYRWGVRGLEYIGREGTEDYVIGPNAVLNLAATAVRACVCYYAAKRQVWWWWAVASGNDPSIGFIYDIVTGGWSRVPSGDPWASVRCAVLFSNTVAASMSQDLKPYVGQISAINRIWKADTGVSDNGTAYRAYLQTGAIEPGGPGWYGAVGDAELVAAAATGVTITATVTADFGLQSQSTGTALLTAEASETIVTRRLEGSALAGDVRFVQHQLGDAAASTAAWTLYRLVVPYGPKDAVSQ